MYLPPHYTELFHLVKSCRHKSLNIIIHCAPILLSARLPTGAVHPLAILFRFVHKISQRVFRCSTGSHLNPGSTVFAPMVRKNISPPRTGVVSKAVCLLKYHTHPNRVCVVFYSCPPRSGIAPPLGRNFYFSTNHYRSWEKYAAKALRFQQVEYNLRNREPTVQFLPGEISLRYMSAR